MNPAGWVNDPKVQAAIARVWQACLARELPMGIFANDAAGAWQAPDQGFALEGGRSRQRTTILIAL
jgi:hypothetical protein